MSRKSKNLPTEMLKKPLIIPTKRHWQKLVLARFERTFKMLFKTLLYIKIIEAIK